MSETMRDGDTMTTTNSEGSRWVDRFRPCRWDRLYQASLPAVNALADLAAREVFNAKLLLVGPYSTGKTSIMRLLGARRCCGRFEKGCPNPCARCFPCRAVFERRRIRGGAYVEIKAIPGQPWIEQFRQWVEVGLGCVNVVQGNPRPLPPLIAIDEVQAASMQQQQEIADAVENSPAGFILAASDLSKLLPHLVQRCRTVFLSPPTKAEFKSWFTEILGRANIRCEEGVTDLFYVASKGVPRVALHTAEALWLRGLESWDLGLVRCHLEIHQEQPLGLY